MASYVRSGDAKTGPYLISESTPDAARLRSKIAVSLIGRLATQHLHEKRSELSKRTAKDYDVDDEPRVASVATPLVQAHARACAVKDRHAVSHCAALRREASFPTHHGGSITRGAQAILELCG